MPQTVELGSFGHLKVWELESKCQVVGTFKKKKKKLKIKLNTNFCAQAIPIAFDFRLPPEVRIYVDFFAATWAICQLVKSLVHEGLTGGLTI